MLFGNINGKQRVKIGSPLGARGGGTRPVVEKTLTHHTTQAAFKLSDFPLSNSWTLLSEVAAI